MAGQSTARTRACRICKRVGSGDREAVRHEPDLPAVVIRVTMDGGEGCGHIFETLSLPIDDPRMEKFGAPRLIGVNKDGD